MLLGKHVKKITRIVLLAALIFIVPFSSTYELAMENDYWSTTENSYIPVLMYHHFEHDKSLSTVVDPDLFREQLIYLKNLGYETITVSDLQLFYDEGKELPDKPLLITMDDGYLSNYTYAYPILKELEMKATIFIVVDNAINDDNLWLKHFDLEQAREMVDSGVIDIQSHTYNSHYKVKDIKGVEKPVLTTRIWDENAETLETEEEYRNRIKEDLAKSKEIIENELGTSVISLSYPYGVYNDTVIEVGKELGYKQFFTIKKGVNYIGDSQYTFKRINVDGSDTGQAIEENIQYYAKADKPRDRVVFFVNDKPTDIKVVVKKGTTYIPVRDTADLLNGSVSWSENESSMQINYNNKNIKLKLASNELIIDDQSYTLSSSPILIDKKMYIPIRTISEQMNNIITWEENWRGNLSRLNVTIQTE